MLGAVWRELPALFFIAVAAGLCHNTMVLAFQRLAGELGPPSERPAAFGLLGLGFSISNLSAPVAAGFAIDHAGFMASFVIFGLVPIIPFIFVWQDRLPWPPVVAHPASADGSVSPARGPMSLLRAPRLGSLYVLCGLFESAWMGFGFMLPIYGSQLGLDATTMGLIAGSAALAIFGVRLFMARVLRRYTPWQLVVGGMVLIGAGFMGFALAGNLFWLVAFAMVIGLGQGIAGPMLNALIYEYSPPHEVGVALGLRTMINNISQAGLPLIAGALGSAFGVGPVFWVMSVMMLGGAWSSRREWRHGRKHM
jgi:predicted MFS family arabinose efflux permease